MAFSAPSTTTLVRLLQQHHRLQVRMQWCWNLPVLEKSEPMTERVPHKTVLTSPPVQAMMENIIDPDPITRAK
jgi:hypothetical protein